MDTGNTGNTGNGSGTDSETKSCRRSFFFHFFQAGGAGIIAAVVILLLFLLCAKYLKFLAFGIILAYFFLPLEKFYEDKVFRKLIRKKTQDQKYLNRLSLHGTLAAVVTVFLVLVLSVTLLFSYLVPLAISAGKTAAVWARKNTEVQTLEEHVNHWLKDKTPEQKKKGWLQPVVYELRENVQEYVAENKSTLAGFAFSKGSDILLAVFSIVKKLGGVLADLVLSFFFFFYFLQKMALFPHRVSGSPGEWCVQLIFDSPWAPKTSDRTREKAAEILSGIGTMLSSWVRGYLSIIILEFPMYGVLYALAGVPYAIPVALLASMTILLPLIGPVLNICILILVCLAFCESNVVFSLVCSLLVYGVINLILEQYVFFPKYVGNALGLTMIETVIVVLLGAMIAGVMGMFLAVPTAGTLKYLITKIYDAEQN